MNHYDILEIPYDSSPELIKSSYKKLARMYHPDAGGDQDMFYEISQAYQTLIDPIAKQNYDYDIGLSDYCPDTEKLYYDNIKNIDIKISHTIKFEQTFAEKKVDIIYNTKDGSTQKVTIAIPPGINNGDVLRVAGAGENYIQGNPRGDLLVKITVTPMDNFSRDMDDLITSHTVNALDLITGCAIVCNVPHHNEVELNIPKGTQPGTVFSLPGYGFPNINTGKTGTLYIKVLASIPKISDPDTLGMIQWIKQHTRKDIKRGSK